MHLLLAVPLGVLGDGRAGLWARPKAAAFIGPLTIRDRQGRRRVNPLFRFDGCFDVSP